MQIKNKKLFLIYLVFGLLAAGELGWQIYDKKVNQPLA